MELLDHRISSKEINGLPGFDLDQLRCLIAVAECGGFAAAAERIGRVQSAVSAQIAKLEEVAGTRLLARGRGRRTQLTEAGEQLLSDARRILALHDVALARFRRPGLGGQLRLATQQDFAQSWLPGLLTAFAARHPGVRLEGVVGSGLDSLKQLARGRLDLAVTLGLEQEAAGKLLGHLPLVWIGRRRSEVSRRRPLPLVTLGSRCRFRQRAVEQLEAAGIPWQVVFTSPSLPGLYAAVAAGLGLTVRTPEGLWPELEVLSQGEDAVLPSLGTVGVMLHESARAENRESAAMVALIRESLPQHLARTGHFLPAAA